MENGESPLTDDLIDWGVAVQVADGEVLPGDQYFIQPSATRVLVAAIDGVGHGPQAAAASESALAILKTHADRPLALLVAICHDALRNTRGVVMALASLDRSTEQMAWLGVGNVEGRLLRAGRSHPHPEEALFLRRGVVGHNIPNSLMVTALPIFKDDVVILATDGIRPEFTAGLHIGKSAHQIANDILSKYSKGTDDALVLVVKYRGGGSSAAS